MIVLLNPRAPRRSVPITGSKEGYGHADTGLPGSRLRTQPPGRPPWVGTLYGPAEVTGNQMVAAMDAVGVNGAILVSPFSMYRYDASYALEVFAAHPSRFRLVKPVDPTLP